MRLLLLISPVLAAVAGSPAMADAWPGKLDCGAGESRFLTERTLDIRDGVVAYASDEPADTQEKWAGVIASDGVVYVQGSYFWEQRKPLFLVGGVEDGVLTLDGWRGPKRCRFEASRLED